MGKLKNELRLKRRSNENKDFELNRNAVLIWEELRKKDTEKLRKEMLIDQLIKVISGNFKNLTRKHDTVRVIQTLIQYGNDDQKDVLFEELKDSIIELSKMKYGKFFVLKMIKYGTVKHKTEIIKSFYGHVQNLLNHACASSVLEKVYNDLANSKQRNELVQEYYGPEYLYFKDSNTASLKDALNIITEEKKNRIIDHLKNQLTKLSDKVAFNHSITHFLLRQFFENANSNDKYEISQFLAPKVVEILHTKDGSRVALYVIWNSTAKERKVLIKSFKKFVSTIAVDENGYLVLLGIFDNVDDTKLIEKQILNEIFSKDKILTIATNKYGRKVLEYLLSPRDTRYFSPDLINILKLGDDNPYSKKDKEIRIKELKEIASPLLLDLCKNYFKELIENGAWLLIYDNLTSTDSAKREEVIIELVKYLADKGSLKNENEHILVKQKDFEFLLKKLIKSDKEHEKNKTSFSQILIDNLGDDILKSYINCNKGCFILLLLLETEIPNVIKHIKNLLGKDEINYLKNSLSDKKGAQLLIENLKN